jgi:hypothetical protein
MFVVITIKVRQKFDEFNICDIGEQELNSIIPEIKLIFMFMMSSLAQRET